MSHRLPVFINPEHACIRGLEVAGNLQLAKMQRLQDRLLAPYGEVDVKLTFHRDDQKNKLKGKISGEMVAECQRCMEAVSIPVAHEFKLAFIESDAEVDALMPGEEPCLTDEKALLLADIIEDELELLLPMVVMHQDPHCGKTNRREDAHETDNDRRNPFAVLAEIKDKVT